MTEISAVLHPDDADLIRWIDQALPDEERSAVDAHLARCEECVTRRTRWEHRSQRLSGLLRSADVPAPATTLRVRLAPAGPSVPLRWRIAAVLVLLIGGAAAVPPVRAWFVEAARAVWERASAGFSARPAGEGMPAIAFVPAGETLTIRLLDEDARLVVEMVAGNQVRMGPQQPPPAVTVLPEELRIGTATDAANEYFVMVPVTLREVRVLLGTRAARVLRPRAAGERHALP